MFATPMSAAVARFDFSRLYTVPRMGIVGDGVHGLPACRLAWIATPLSDDSKSIERFDRKGKSKMGTERVGTTIADDLPPEVAEAFSRVIRFRDIRPTWERGGGANARHIPLYKYTDKANSDFVGGMPARLDSKEIRLTTGVLAPGEGARFHNHTTEELMFVASGSWVVFFDEEEKYKVHLEPMDAILVPANLKRGWRNVGQTIGCFLNISNVNDEMVVASCTVDSPEEN